MIRWILQIIVILFITACDAPVAADKSQIDKPDTTTLSANNNKQPVKQKLNIINLIHPNGTDSIARFYDTIVNGIIIGDILSVQKVAGKILPRIKDNEKSSFGILDRVCIYNNSQTQFLTLYFFPDDKQMFFEIQVEDAADQTIQKSLTIPDEEFVTGKGIKLGMNEKEFLKLFGKPSETSRSPYGITKYSYQQYDGAYYGDYYFRNGVLFKFKFGRELILCT